MSQSHKDLDPQTRQGLKRYWRDNQRIIFIMLIIWFVFSFVLSIFFVRELNEFKLGGFPLGFWIAQQGSIFVFIIMVLVYCFMMEYGDKKFHLEEQKKKGDDE